MGKISFRHLLSLFFICCIFHLHAREPYDATVTVGPVSVTISDPNLVDLSRSLQSPAITELIPFYTPTTPISILFNFRGIEALTAFPADSTTLFVTIPETNTTLTFAGGTRENSITLFKDYVRDAGTNHNLLRAYAKDSPIDPIAGNPNSLLAQMAQYDYLAGHLSPFSGCDSCWKAQPIVHQFQAGLKSGRAFDGGYDTTIVTIPLRYSYSPNLDWALIIDSPLTYYRNGGASSFFSSLGIGFRLPLLQDWSITSSVRLGAGGSLDLCTSGCFLLTGLNSVYNYKISDFIFSLTNYAGYYTSVNLWLTGINFNYQLQNYIFKNGLSFTSCRGWDVWNKPVNFSVSFTDSYFPSGRLYLRHYDEIEVSLLINSINPCIDYDCLSIGFAYQFGEKSLHGYYLNIVYQF